MFFTSWLVRVSGVEVPGFSILGAWLTFLVASPLLDTSLIVFHRFIECRNSSGVVGLSKLLVAKP